MIRGTGIDSTVKTCVQSHGLDTNNKFFDKSQTHATITVYGGAENSSDDFKFASPGVSMYFDGTDSELTFANPLNSATVFSIRYWAKSVSAVGRHFGSAGTPYCGVINTATNMTIYVSSTLYLDFPRNWTITDWQYYNIIGDGTNIKLYVGGILKASAAFSSVFGGGATMTIGNWFGQLGFFDGYIDDFIISVGSIPDGTYVPTRRIG